MRVTRAILGIGLAVILWMAGCGEQTPEELFAAAEVAAADSSSQDQAIQYFTDFLARYPHHDSCPNALRSLALIAQQKGDIDGAIVYYERLLADHATSDYGDEAQFMLGYIYEEYLGDLEKARLAYQRVIDNYPDSELAASARFLIPNLGRDPEEWVNFGNGAASVP